MTRLPVRLAMLLVLLLGGAAQSAPITAVSAGAGEFIGADRSDGFDRQARDDDDEDEGGGDDDGGYDDDDDDDLDDAREEDDAPGGVDDDDENRFCEARRSSA